MLRDLFFALWFFLPAGVANMMPILAAKLPIIAKFNYPIDCNLNLKNTRIFGDHKTWRGLLVGVISATFVLWLQQRVVIHFGFFADWTSQVNYAALPVLVLGPLFALGALAGDAVESFFKRRRGIKPGGSWFPFDQTDYIVGGAIATIPFVQLSILQYIWLLLLWLLMHMAASYIGFLVGLKDKPI